MGYNIYWNPKPGRTKTIKREEETSQNPGKHLLIPISESRAYTEDTIRELCEESLGTERRALQLLALSQQVCSPPGAPVHSAPGAA